MNLQRTGTLLAQELRAGLRSPLPLIGILAPVILTALLYLVFGQLGSKPRLGILDLGASELVSAAKQRDSLVVLPFISETDLREALHDHDLDAALVLQENFDNLVRTGQTPVFQLQLSAFSSAYARLTVSAALLDLVRELAGNPLPIEVKMISTSGQDSVSLMAQLIPALVLLAVMVCALLIPAAGLVAERESGSINALLATPAQLSEILVAKGLFGIILGLLSGTIILILTGGFVNSPVAMLAILGLAGLMCAEFGLLLGAVAPNANMLFILFRVAVLVLATPTIAWFWSGYPEWASLIAPSFYFIDPLYQVTVKGAGFGAIAMSLTVGIVICAALAVLVLRTAQRQSPPK